MLAELQIQDFAIIDRLSLRLGPSFNVLTGETGAGKSIIVDAVQALIGGRTGSEFVRAGAPMARVEGVFEPAPDSDLAEGLRDLCADLGIDLDEGLILTREIQATGRTTCRINGRPVPQSVLRSIGEHLVDIHGQSEHLSLLRTSEHVELLDRFGGLMPLRATAADLVQQVRQVRRTIEQLRQDERELARRVDLLRFQVDEIEAAQLRPGEDGELEAERNRLANAERLAQDANTAYDALVAGENDESAAIDRLSVALQAVQEIGKIDTRMVALAEQLEAALYQLEDVGRTIRSYRDGIEYQPERLEAIAERLDLIKRLQRKYGGSIEEVLEFGRRAALELETITHAEERLAALTAEEQHLLERLGRVGSELSERRRNAGTALVNAIEHELRDLNMGGARFAVESTQRPDASGAIEPDTGRRVAFDEKGLDRVEFLIAPNPGEPPKPLAKIASGGETARIMLALKSVLRREDRVGTLIFDEIDVGIGGRSGLMVGQKLWELAANHQVLCVTHLPQTASYGDTHYLIEKQVVGDRTVAQVRELGNDERANELAQMLGGAVTEATRRSGHELLDRSAERKRQAVGT